MALEGEVAVRRTHPNAVLPALPQYVLVSPELSTVLLVALIGGVLVGIVCALRPLRFSLAGRCVLTLVLLVAMPGTGLGAADAVLWLRYPEQHAQWSAGPVAFIVDAIGGQLEWPDPLAGAE